MEDLLKIPDVDVRFFKELVNSSLNGVRTWFVLKSAVELGIFDLLKVPMSVEEISERLNCDKRLIKLFCKVLCGLKLLVEKDGRFVNTELSNALLTKDSFYSQKVFLSNAERAIELWGKLTEILRNGPIKRDPSEFFAERAIHSLAQYSLLGELQETVKIVSELPEFKRAKRLLDLGGGHGLYAIAFTKLNPNLEAIVFDLPEVVEKTKEYIRKFGASRVKVMAGNFFKDDIGRGYDIVFSSYNPGGKKAELIPKIYSSLNEGGVYVNRQIFRDGKEISLIDLEWNLWSFEGVEKDDRAYRFKNDLSLDEYVSELEKVGFEIVEVITLDEEMGSKMIIAKKPSAR